MKKFSLKKTAALVLSLLMLVGVVPTAAFAAGTDYASETHDVFKHTESTLAPGVEQYINYAYAKDGKLSYYPDYAASNLTDAVPAEFQELVNGTKKPADVLKNIHEKYDTGVEDMGVKNN